MAKIKALRNGTKKDVITRKGAALFRKKGFSASSMRELADSIGVEASSLYNHIGSKVEILQNICFNVANAFNQNLEQVEKSTTNAAARMESLVRFHISMMLNTYDEVYVANHEWKHLEDPYLANFLIQRKNYENRLISIINTGIKNGEFRKTDPHLAVLFILSAVRGLEFWPGHKKISDSQDLANNIVDHLLNGIIK